MTQYTQARDHDASLHRPFYKASVEVDAWDRDEPRPVLSAFDAE